MGGLHLIGAPITRKEDYRFATRAWTCTNDVQPERQSLTNFVRLPHVHAIIQRIGAYVVERLAETAARERIVKLRCATWPDLSRIELHQRRRSCTNSTITKPPA